MSSVTPLPGHYGSFIPIDSVRYISISSPKSVNVNTSNSAQVLLHHLFWNIRVNPSYMCNANASEACTEYSPRRMSVMCKVILMSDCRSCVHSTLQEFSTATSWFRTGFFFITKTSGSSSISTIQARQDTWSALALPPADGVT